jgi:hypothetical protein
MSGKLQSFAVVMFLLFCGLGLAQQPVQDIDPKLHPNLAEAQRLVIKANQYVETAQHDMKYDMKGHADRARQLLVQVNEELKAAAREANRAMESQQKAKH